MTKNHSVTDTIENISRHLPFLRRYGRALVGSQAGGDTIAAATLSSIADASQRLDADLDPKVALFELFQRFWTDIEALDFVSEADPLTARAQHKLSRLQAGSRNALLLKALEQFSIEETAQIMHSDIAHVQSLLDTAYFDMAERDEGRILIIEDDTFIANEIESIVIGMGHLVTGNASTKSSAVAMALEDEPDLILADVVLADHTSGADAADEIVRIYDGKPVIFVTGHPEQLLTGKKPEPTFLIPKPYMHEQVRAAVNQALFFGHVRADENMSDH